MYKVEFTKQAMKALNNIPKNYAIIILRKIKQLSVNPYDAALDIKKLQGMFGVCRLRVGDYRVIYEVEGKRLISIIKIQNRGNVYG